MSGTVEWAYALEHPAEGVTPVARARLSEDVWVSVRYHPGGQPRVLIGPCSGTLMAHQARWLGAALTSFPSATTARREAKKAALG